MSDAVVRATALLRGGDLAAAEHLLVEALGLEPLNAEALHFLGILRYQQGSADEAVKLIQQALQQVPAYADAHNNLGNIHKECGRLEAAEACYRRALECMAHDDALSNLALVLEARGSIDEAFDAHRNLVGRNPDYPDAWLRLGIFLRRNAKTAEHLEVAIRCFVNASSKAPSDTRVLSELGIVLHMLGRHVESQDVYREWLRRDPANPVAQHRLASCGGTAAPARASDSYVSKVFDDFADSFDDLLLHKLHYRAPQVLVAALSRNLPPPAAALDILDAGCGTGLCGPMIKPWARHLVGVDLSAGMIDKARPRAVYDVLEVAELTAYLQANCQAFDVVLSADTLVYFGALNDVFDAAFESLRPGGWLGFSLEALQNDGDEVRLNSSGRYAHSRLHVSLGLEQAGFQDWQITPEVLRKEAGNPVHGWVVTASRGAQKTL